jgi:hypothetical protein
MNGLELLHNRGRGIHVKKFSKFFSENDDFSLQYTFPESGKRFFASKISNSNSPHIFTPKGSFPEKIFENIFTWVTPLLCSSSAISYKFALV